MPHQEQYKNASKMGVGEYWTFFRVYSAFCEACKL